MTAPLPRTDLTTIEVKMLRALAGCTFTPGSFDKRFVRDIQGQTALTEKQRDLLHKTFYRYRRQMGLTDRSAQRIVDQAQGKGDGYPLLTLTEAAEL